MINLHQQLPANTLGRDFIIGDLHGCLDLLQIELKRVQFDPTHDRLFSVGDLIDRGPDAMGCLRLLHEPWFFAVRGNHENMLLDYFYENAQPYAFKTAAKVFLQNGGHWVQELQVNELDELRESLLPRVAVLPYVITVGSQETRFHVAHAELMTGNIDQDHWLAVLAGLPEDRTPQRILTDDLLTDKLLESMLDPLVWGRRLLKKVDFKLSQKISTQMGTLLKSQQPMYPGLSLTYVGHTPLTYMILHESHLFIDRGAYGRSMDSRLLMLEHGETCSWIK